PEKYAAAVANRDETGLEDEFAPILPGPGGSDYERYLRTDELLSLQKTAEEQAHRDELLFQVVHQSSELWLKLAWHEVEQATAGGACARAGLPRTPAGGGPLAGRRLPSRPRARGALPARGGADRARRARDRLARAPLQGRRADHRRGRRRDAGNARRAARQAD